MNKEEICHSEPPRGVWGGGPFRHVLMSTIKQYYVYIMANRAGTLYTGVTGNLERRVAEHKSGTIPGFTRRYNIKQVVFVESTSDVTAAIAREKQIKGWSRAKKVALIESMNPDWRDLSNQLV